MRLMFFLHPHAWLFIYIAVLSICIDCLLLLAAAASSARLPLLLLLLRLLSCLRVSALAAVSYIYRSITYATPNQPWVHIAAEASLWFSEDALYEVFRYTLMHAQLNHFRILTKKLSTLKKLDRIVTFRARLFKYIELWAFEGQIWPAGGANWIALI